MKSNQVEYKSVDEYMATFPQEIRSILQELRSTIRASAPEAVEKISYQMPTLYFYGNLVHFAAFKDHISFFPGAITNISSAFAEEISAYITGKGTLQFPLGKPLPLDLIARITQYRVAQNLAKSESKTKKKKKA